VVKFVKKSQKQERFKEMREIIQFHFSNQSNIFVRYSKYVDVGYALMSAVLISDLQDFLNYNNLEYCLFS